jgi:hypothetical protein
MVGPVVGAETGAAVGVAADAHPLSMNAIRKTQTQEILVFMIIFLLTGFLNFSYSADSFLQ